MVFNELQLVWFYASRKHDATTQIELLPNVFLTLTGESPYPGKKARQVANLLQTGYRMRRPRHLAKEL